MGENEELMVAELQVDRDVNYYLNQLRDLVTVS